MNLTEKFVRLNDKYYFVYSHNQENGTVEAAETTEQGMGVEVGRHTLKLEDFTFVWIKLSARDI